MLNFFTRMKNKKGFTLIELIIVIAILGVLVAIAVPRFTGFRDDAVTARNDANEAMLYKAASIYVAQCEGTTTFDDTTWDGSASQLWSNYIEEWPTGWEVEFDNSTRDITVTAP